VEPPALAKIRWAILAIVTLGTSGMCVELVLLEHYGDAEQMIPLGVGAAGLLILGWVAVSPAVVALRTLQFVMLVFVGSGVIGATLHVQAEVEAPALAPGLLVQLGMLGLLYTYQHPALNPRDR
jgi:hypothetical protein